MADRRPGGGGRGGLTRLRRRQARQPRRAQGQQGNKGNKGDQNYPIPADVNLADCTGVSIWCDRFDVSFGAAALTPA
ncbi:hypothetical protein AVW11_03070 [Streptomyces amritsarensis]|uniref:DM13 domain-containing protein n=1 Tax=Streptomyces amritsarensis TaxID=681158 RepID=A0ABX3GBF1_9ACTN|nr:hypothetical protein AVW11_03070 [Streptomyces amritsarensis]